MARTLEVKKAGKENKEKKRKQKSKGKKAKRQKAERRNDSVKGQVKVTNE